MAQTQASTPASLIDDVSVKDSYADAIAGVAFTNGALHITFASFTADHTKGDPAHLRRIVSARLVLNPPAMLELRDMLNNLVTSLIQQGTLTPTPPTPTRPN